MILVVTGCRYLNDHGLFLSALKASGFQPEEIVHGGAPGIDTMAKFYASKNNIKEREFSADWDRHRRAAGPIRNQAMIDYVKDKPDKVLLAIWDGKSRGTFDCIKKAFEARVPIYVHMSQ